jgi:hypothetical protein
MIDPRVQTLVRENRNMRLHVLFVLWASPGPLSAIEVARVINCSRDAVDEALPALEFDGYAARFPAGRHACWWVTDKARQLSLPGLSSDIDQGKTLVNFSTTTTALSDPPDRVKAVAVAKPESGKTRVSKALENALRAAGIGSNAWAGLAELKHVTPEFVVKHTAYARGRGDSVGLLITRLRCGDVVPELRTKAEIERECLENDWAADAERCKRAMASLRKVRK